MRAIRDGEPSVEIVLAAQRGDRAALGTLLSEYLPLLYNIVGRALNGHADVDDVVQETMLRVVRGLGDLRDPAAFRSWLVAVAVRQVRDHVARRTPATRGLAPEVADPDADFVDLTILRLGLSGQRRETAEATRWLDSEDREVLALWWQETAGTLDRSAVVSGLGVTPAHAAVRIGRMKERLTAARLVVRALRAQPPCPALSDMTAGWDQTPSPLWRKRLARHARDCPRCNSYLADLVPAEQLLRGLPLLPVPLLALPLDAILRQAAAARHAGPARHLVPGRHGPAGRWTAALRHARALPKAAAALPPKAVVTGVVATACVAAGTVAVTRIDPGRPARPAVAVGTPRPARTPPPRSPSPQPRATHAAARVTTTQKGVAVWSFPGVSQALADSGSSWYYNWSTSPAGVVSPRGVSFVPMIWGSADMTGADLAQARSQGDVLLSFNEPDLSSQANMTVAQALSLWPRLMATGMELGSPAVADDAATPGGWLDQFMRGAAARGYRVNFIDVHWYGADFATGAAVSQLRSYLQAIYARYHLPIWLTELGLANFGGSPAFPTEGQQAAFVTAASAMLGRLGYVQRYAWYALPATSGDGDLGLFSPGPVVTPVGRAFEAAGR
jgi:RNA polymerase sigma factor (sigma-70 family)